MEKQQLPIIIIEGPSAVGKDSVMKRLCEISPGKYKKIASVTSRPKRVGEVDGETYFFVTGSEFESMVKSGDVFEFTQRHGTYRGMSKNVIDGILAAGQIPMKDCDLIGAEALKKEYGKRVLMIFVVVAKDEAERRMRGRGDSEEDIEKRLKDFDIKVAEADKYDFVVENIVIDDTARHIERLIDQFMKQKRM